jgi:hypothetical protein
LGSGLANRPLRTTAGLAGVAGAAALPVAAWRGAGALGHLNQSLEQLNKDVMPNLTAASGSVAEAVGSSASGASTATDILEAIKKYAPWLLVGGVGLAGLAGLRRLFAGPRQRTKRKEACDSWPPFEKRGKQGDEPDVKQYSKRRRSHPSMVEYVLSRHPGGGPRMSEERAVIDPMRAAEGDALSTLEVQLGRPASPLANYKRIWKNPRTGPIGKGIGGTLGLLGLLNSGYSEEEEQAGPYYHPLQETAVQPWRAPAATLHELGHAIDFNKSLFGGGKVPKSWLGRQAKGTLRDVYTFAPGTSLWKEHQAWRKGQKAYMQGAAKQKRPIEEVHKQIADVQHAKYPALGTYWGATGGLTAGVAGAIAALALAPEGAKAPLAYASLLGLPVAGLLSGLGIGTVMRGGAKRRAQKRVEKKYPGMVEKAKEASDDTACVSPHATPLSVMAAGDGDFSKLKVRGWNDYDPDSINETLDAATRGKNIPATTPKRITT